MGIEFNDQQMNLIISGAILQTLTPEMREKLLKDAIASLIVPKRDSYGSIGKTPLQEAFEQSARQVAYQMLTKQLSEDDDFKAKVKAVMTDAIELVFVKQRESVVNSMANGFTRYLEAERKNY